MDINQVWPEWHEDCVLGEGSFGKVFRAKRIEYGRTFYSAIKVISVPKNQQEIRNARSQGMNDSEIYAYFQSLVDNLLNEITLMDNLKGAQNVVGIDDYKIIEHEGEIGWDIFIRMELLTPFDSFVSNPQFSQKDVIRLGIDICTALEVCEHNSIIHRDIKPDNIFVSKFGEYKLGDFGIARKLETAQANLSRKGTLNFMAPEVYKSENYGTTVDIYSLGLVLYALLNNNRIAFLPPYPQPITYKDNEDALSMRLSGEPIVPPCNASASLSQTILKACEYLPQNRYSTATEFKNALINEWNAIVQSGDSDRIQSDAMRFSSQDDIALGRTTNDMTANGRLVVDEYAEGTTVLSENGQNNGSSYRDDNYSATYYEQQNINFQNVPSQTIKSNKFCRILSYPILIATIVLAVIMLLNSKNSIDSMMALSLLGAGAVAVIADFNKYSLGICMAMSTVGYISEGLTGLVGGGIKENIPISAVVVLVSGILALVGSISVIAQREVRFGGTMFLYAFAFEWLYTIYMLINGDYIINIYHVYYSIAELAVLVWAYGYNSKATVKGIKKILLILTLIVSVVIAFIVIISTVKTFIL